METGRHRPTVIAQQRLFEIATWWIAILPDRGVRRVQYPGADFQHDQLGRKLVLPIEIVQREIVGQPAAAQRMVEERSRAEVAAVDQPRSTRSQHDDLGTAGES